MDNKPMDYSTCQTCGHSIARHQGYVLVPTPWGVESRHKDGQCVTPYRNRA